MGLEMAGKTRHLKEKDGRFYARIAVPATLRSAIGKSELVTPLGGDRRAALRLLPETAAELLRRLDEARPQEAVAAKLPRRASARSLRIAQLAVKSYKDRLRQDSMLRESSDGAGVPIDTDYAALLRDGMAGRLTVEVLESLSAIDQVMLGASGAASASGLSRFSRLRGLIRSFSSSAQ